MALVCNPSLYTHSRPNSIKGELSAINGMAGAASEHVPVVQVVGQTLRPMQAGHKLIHHSIGDWPDHQVFG